MNVRRELDSLLESVPAAEMSDLIGELERVKSAAYCRMLARETQQAANGSDPKPQADLSTTEIARMHNRKSQTVRGWIGRGLLVAYKFQGREWRIKPENLERFKRERREPLKLEAVGPEPNLNARRKAAGG